MSGSNIMSETISLGEENPVEIAMVVDVSDSMGTKEAGGSSRLALAQSACIKLIGIMRQTKDALGLCSFNTAGNVEWGDNHKVKLLEKGKEAQGGNPAVEADKVKAMKAVYQLKASGTTDMEPGLDLASKMFTNATTNKAVILMSDGQDNVGGKQNELDMAGDLNDAGKEVYTFAIGSGADVDFLRKLAGSTRSGTATGMPVGSTLVGDDKRFKEMDSAFNAQKEFNEIAGQLGIAHVLLNEIKALNSTEFQGSIKPQTDHKVPKHKTSVVIAIAWDRLNYKCAGVNTNALLAENQVAFNVGKVNANSSLDFTPASDLKVEIKDDKGLVFVKVSNAKEGDRYGVEMQKYFGSTDQIRFSVGVFA